MATLTNASKNSATLTNQSRSATPATEQFLLIGDGYQLLIDSTYKLRIQSASSGTTLTNLTKN